MSEIPPISVKIRDLGRIEVDGYKVDYAIEKLLPASMQSIREHIRATEYLDEGDHHVLDQLDSLIGLIIFLVYIYESNLINSQVDEEPLPEWCEDGYRSIRPLKPSRSLS